MFEDLLVRAGLTKNEAAIYMAIIELGECTSGEVMKKAHTRTGRIYDILNSLVDKGLVSFIVRNNVKHFLAAEPARLMDYLAEREARHKRIEAELSKAIPDITARKRIAEKATRVEVYEGVEGFKTAANAALAELTKNDEMLIIGTQERMLELLAPYYVYFNKQRIARGIPGRYIYRPELIEQARLRSRWKLTKVRIVPLEMRDPAYIFIVGNYVITMLLAEKPLTILVKSRENAAGYREYFDFVWNRSLTIAEFGRKK